MFDIALVEGGTVGQPALAQPTDGRRDHRPGRGEGRSPSLADTHLESPAASDMDRWRHSMEAGCPVRWGRVNVVRASIARGDYLNEQRLDEAMSRLVSDLDH